ncbi:hypothetical protein EGR_07521 [Echinococcus granulosus]|uniref:Uncharacterized protein n=1 Tax=Echinococcus granulosus TaxID=6210 RepID=W6U9F6_ECHGR|nr:hypothetical protein EGR_07521 [Echinococcus granulosus]EUB57645.1 hypothetical protein EGR_07521 [Echinococcus granulosus]
MAPESCIMARQHDDCTKSAPLRAPPPQCMLERQGIFSICGAQPFWQYDLGGCAPSTWQQSHASTVAPTHTCLLPSAVVVTATRRRSECVISELPIGLSVDINAY